MIVQYLRAVQYRRPPKKRRRTVRGDDLKSRSTDELWEIHEEVAFQLTQKLEAEKARLEQRLRQLQGADNISDLGRSRRPYPPVPPKYRNPENPMQIWSGRGKQPRWLGPQIQAGRQLDDFLIDRTRRH
ncbi:H-NS histone family protein [Bradyrhizobium sp. MOS001]|nr:H-NS histone family protein [Bradyrhizobium sp. MOS001]